MQELLSSQNCEDSKCEREPSTEEEVLTRMGRAQAALRKPAKMRHFMLKAGPGMEG